MQGHNGYRDPGMVPSPWQAREPGDDRAGCLKLLALMVLSVLIGLTIAGVLWARWSS